MGGIFGLGVYHGLNPGMGWLFAVALALQERRRRALLQGLAWIAVGHFLAVGVVALLTIGLEGILSPRLLRAPAAFLLAAWGVHRLVRPRHPRWVGMRVGARDLVLWSALMASGHGAGLMLLPFLLGPLCVAPNGAGLHGVLGAIPAGAGAVLAHTLGYFLAMGGMAWAVYEWIGLAVLPRIWVNLDRLWAGALIGTGLLTLFL